MSTINEQNNPEQQPSKSFEELQVDRRRAAQMLNYSPATFDRLVKRGLIPANRATGRPRFSIAELKRFVDECSK